MRTILVTCKTIEDEVKATLDQMGLDYQVVWLEGGLHNNPSRLREKLQEILDEADGRCDQLIFTLGYCGGGVSGLSTGNYTTVLPLADDCLSLLLGSMAARRAASSPPTYFLTQGWMRHENNVVDSYQATVEKYGEARADRINKLMLANYKRFGLVDTGVYHLGQAAAKVAPLAAKMDLEVEILPATSGWLKRLLIGPYDDPAKFMILPPRSELDFDQWCAFLEGSENTGEVQTITPPLT